MREQENDMRIQVQLPGFRRQIDIFWNLYRGTRDVWLALSPQLEMYSKKFDEFQGTVSKSNSVYSDFKQDMDKVRTVPHNIRRQLHDVGYVS